MLIDHIRRHYEERGKERRQSGSPSGSRLGTCAAQLQQLQYPEISPPTPLPARSMLTFEMGDYVEEWFGEQLRRLIPGEWGLQQEPYYFPVPLRSRDELAILCRKAEEGRLVLYVWDDFAPPRISVNEETGKIRLRTARGQGIKGAVVDSARLIVWVPVHPDGLLAHPEVGLSVAEIKSMSTPSFRKALEGAISYGYRCQLAAEVESSGVQNAVWFAYRKETSHLLEIVYTKKAERATVRIHRMNGTEEVYSVETAGEEETTLRRDGEEASVPGDREWEAAQVVTPFEPGLVADMQARARAVLLFEPRQDGTWTWTREYGPAFECRKCGASGQVRCRNCGGSGITRKAGKPCVCVREKRHLPDQPGVLACEKCGGKGRADRVELPAFPCGYCPVVGSCYPFAELEVDERPHYYVTRDAWERSGITFQPPQEIAKRERG